MNWAGSPPPRAPTSGARLRAPCGPLAQLVEQGTLNPKVEGSNPSRPISNLGVVRGKPWAAAKPGEERQTQQRRDRLPAGPRRLPPEQIAEVKANACTLPHTHGVPLSRLFRLPCSLPSPSLYGTRPGRRVPSRRTLKAIGVGRCCVDGSPRS